MYVRLAGCDAEVEFHTILADVVTRMEERFPWPEYAVMFADSQQEEAPDQLVLARRYGGILVPMVYLPIEEIDQLEAQGADWMTEISSDLARTEEEIQEVIKAERAKAEAAAEAEAEAEPDGGGPPPPADVEAARPDDRGAEAIHPGGGEAAEAGLGDQVEPGLGGPPSDDFSDSIVATLRNLDIPHPDELKAALAAEREAEESGDAEAEATDAGDAEAEAADDPKDQD